jgi:hypothetical protein
LRGVIEPTPPPLYGRLWNFRCNNTLVVTIATDQGGRWNTINRSCIRNHNHLTYNWSINKT